MFAVHGCHVVDAIDAVFWLWYDAGHRKEIDMSRIAKSITRNKKGDIVSTVYGSFERMAPAYGLSVEELELEWAIDEHGQCEVDGPWPGQTTVITEAEDN